MDELRKKITCIVAMIVCASWIAGVIAKSMSVGIIFGAACVAYICYQSLNDKEDDK